MPIRLLAASSHPPPPPSFPRSCARQVASNVDRGSLARKRDVGMVIHNQRLRDLQKEAAELEVPFPFPAPVGK